MKISDEKLKDLLVKPGHITEDQFKTAQTEAQGREVPLEKVLIDKDYISDEHLGQVMADHLGYKFINLATVNIPDDVLHIVPEIMAKKSGVIAFEKNKDGLKLAMTDPYNMDIINLIQKKSGSKVIPYYMTRRNLEQTMSRYRKGLEKEFSEVIKENVKKSKGAKAEDVPIIKIIDTILAYAYFNKASDVHIEPQDEKIMVRFRVDGVLHDVLVLPSNIHEQVVTRVKILAKMRTDEHRAAQDGKLNFKTEAEEVDVRVSVVPITDGEKIVLRLLSEKQRQFSLEDLGLVDSDLEKVRKVIKRPHGMILTTGPTGCGKTTTLYAILKILNTRSVNISTIEDPVEYDVEGVNQIQVNPKTNLTFAKGLRSIVRQDPDIIMVGEIRDDETAGIAINSAMTGHLVLSTLHTNDVATTMPRLIDMKIEPFLVASTVNVAIAQRLVRKICVKCRESHQVESDELELLKNFNFEKVLGEKNLEELTVFKGKGCDVCQHTGYTGRIGVFEVLEMDKEIRELIMQRADAGQIQAKAIEKNMTTMLEDGMKKVLSGITTVEEILRVTEVNIENGNN